jgi:hypothetical protein
VDELGTQFTLVAFHGEKPPALSRLLVDCQDRIRAVLGGDFAPCALGPIHGTVVGMERVPGTRRDNLNLEHLLGRRVPMDLKGFLGTLPDRPGWPLEVRFGGFPRGARPFASRGATPWERTFSIQGDKAVLIGWPVLPGDPDRYPPTLERLRRQAEAFNILHAYHRTPAEADNDLYLRLGTVGGKERAPSADGDLETALRETLAARPVTVPLSLDDLRVAVYRDPTLPIDSTTLLDPRSAASLKGMG